MRTVMRERWHVWGLPEAGSRLRVPGWFFEPAVGALVTLVVFAALTASLAPLFGERELVIVSMFFLLTVLLVSATWGYVVGLFGAVLADLSLNFFFVPPLHRFTVHEPRNVAALGMFLAVAVIGASMLAMLRRQLRAARERRAELAVMLELSRQLAAASTPERALDALATAVVRGLEAKRCVILVRSEREWRVAASTGGPLAVSREDAALAQSAVQGHQIVRRLADGRDRRPISIRVARSAVADTFVPFSEPTREPGVIHIIGRLEAPPDGGLDALLWAFADEAGVAIHRARLAEQARHSEAVQRSDEFKTALLSSVSHDLRSPLTAIKAAVGSLRTEGLDWSEEDQAQLLETIESQTDRLTDTISDLLDMSRLEGGAVHPALEAIDVRVLFQDAVNETRVAAAGREVCVDVLGDLWVHADYGLLLRAITNLIENAAKYSTPGGTITVSGAEAGGRVTIDISDEGPGIATEDLPHIFDRFYRGSVQKRVPGTGLGLTIVRAMVELCQGRVTVDSSPSGTIFHVQLKPAGRPA